MLGCRTIRGSTKILCYSFRIWSVNEQHYKDTSQTLSRKKGCTGILPACKPGIVKYDTCFRFILETV